MCLNIHSFYIPNGTSVGWLEIIAFDIHDIGPAFGWTELCSSDSYIFYSISS